MFQPHILEQNFEFHSPDWLQGFLDFADEGVIRYSAFVHIFPAAPCQPAARFDGGAKIGGH
jgi:hypothetical protein